MLVLSRHVSEQIRIGSDITVTVCEIRPGTVRIGIDAPRDVKIVHQSGHFTRANDAVFDQRCALRLGHMAMRFGKIDASFGKIGA